MPDAPTQSPPSPSARRAHPARPGAQAGVALIIALIMLSAILVVTGVLLRNSRQQEQASAGESAVARAQFAAELGLRQAVANLTSGLTSHRPLPVSATAKVGPFTATGGDYTYAYTIEYKKTASQPPEVAYTSQGQPVFVIKAMGESGRARRKAELAVIDMYNPTPFGFGLVGCEGVWLDSNTRTRSLNSEAAAKGDTTQVFPGSNSKTAAFSNLGSIVALRGSNSNTKRKQYGAVIVGSGSQVRGDILSAGDIQLSGTSVVGTRVATDLSLILNGSTSIEARIYASSITGTAKFAGAAQNLNLGVTEDWKVGQSCDGLGVTGNTGIVQQRINSAQTSNQNKTDNTGNLIGKYIFKPDTSTPTLSEKGTSSKPVTIDMGVACSTPPCAERTYYLTSATFDVNVIINVLGPVNLVMNGPLTMIGSGKPSSTKLNISPRGELRIFTNSDLFLNSVDFNYADALAAPTSVIIYSSAPNSSTIVTTPTREFATQPDKTVARVQVNAPNTPVRALVYAPLSYVWLKNNNDYYGALRGRWILMDSGTTFTFDVAASTRDATRQGYRIAYWAEEPYDSYTPIN